MEGAHNKVKHCGYFIIKYTVFTYTDTSHDERCPQPTTSITVTDRVSNRTNLHHITNHKKSSS